MTNMTLATAAFPSDRSKCLICGGPTEGGALICDYDADPNGGDNNEENDTFVEEPDGYGGDND